MGRWNYLGCKGYNGDWTSAFTHCGGVLWDRKAQFTLLKPQSCASCLGFPCVLLGISLRLASDFPDLTLQSRVLKLHQSHRKVQAVTLVILIKMALIEMNVF